MSRAKQKLQGRIRMYSVLQELLTYPWDPSITRVDGKRLMVDYSRLAPIVGQYQMMVGLLKEQIAHELKLVP